MSAREFPAGCTITNIRRGKGERSRYIYAELVAPDGHTIICADIPYIAKQLEDATIGGITKEEPK
jgi:hypothetical protein